MKVKVRIETRYGYNEYLGKCEYSHGNSLYALCFNVNSGSAVTHKLVFFSQLSLSESIHMSVFALSSDNQGDSLIFGVVVLICLLGKGEIIWGLKLRGTKRATCALKFGAGLISWGLVCHGPRHFLCFFFRNCTADYFMS